MCVIGCCVPLCVCHGLCPTACVIVVPCCVRVVSYAPRNAEFCGELIMALGVLPGVGSLVQQLAFPIIVGQASRK